MKIIRIILVCLLLTIGAIGAFATPVSAGGQNSNLVSDLTALKGIYEKILQSGNPD